MKNFLTKIKKKKKRNKLIAIKSKFRGKNLIGFSHSISLINLSMLWVRDHIVRFDIIRSIEKTKLKGK